MLVVTDGENREVMVENTESQKEKEIRLMVGVDIGGGVVLYNL